MDDVAEGNLNAPGGTEAIELFPNDKRMDFAEGRLKLLEVMVDILLLSRKRVTSDFAEGNLNASEGTEVILLSFRDKIMFLFAEGKLKPVGLMVVI